MIKYCTKELREQDGKYYYKNILSSKRTVELYLTLSSPKPIYKIDVREAKETEETSYVGWLDNEGNIDYVYPNRVLLEVCFQYGTKVETEYGKGRVIRIFIKEIGQED